MLNFVLNLIFLQRDRDTITKLIEGSIPSSAIQENGLPEWIATAWQLHVEIMWQ